MRFVGLCADTDAATYYVPLKTDSWRRALQSVNAFRLSDQYYPYTQ